MTVERRCKKLDKAKQILARCKSADVEPPMWVKVLLGITKPNPAKGVRV